MNKLLIYKIIFCIFAFLSLLVWIQFSFDILFWILGFMLARLLNKRLLKRNFKITCYFILILTALFYAYNTIISCSYFYTILNSDAINSKEEFSYVLETIFIYGTPQPLRFFFETLLLFVLMLQIFLPALGIGFIFSAFLNFYLEKKRVKK